MWKSSKIMCEWDSESHLIIQARGRWNIHEVRHSLIFYGFVVQRSLRPFTVDELTAKSELNRLQHFYMKKETFHLHCLALVQRDGEVCVVLQSEFKYLLEERKSSKNSLKSDEKKNTKKSIPELEGREVKIASEAFRAGENVHKVRRKVLVKSQMIKKGRKGEARWIPEGHQVDRKEIEQTCGASIDPEMGRAKKLLSNYQRLIESHSACHPRHSRPIRERNTSQRAPLNGFTWGKSDESHPKESLNLLRHP